ncbi:TonB-dependent receptor plug domain-containing protein [Thalassococcus sp. BH17M4-6]|uniref:TonB-dependent receptor plug domain-containing protein n=1 Tax=Thalassococcus sp. BH17M4-6 TaxID=3413148 RepID=UPI003BEBEEB7
MTCKTVIFGAACSAALFLTHAAEARGARCSTLTIEALSSDDLQRLPGTNVTDALNSLPGVRFENGTTLQPGQGATNVTVRGLGDGRPGPLIIVDGQRTGPDSYTMNNGALPDPEDIERIEVLRGPVAASIYGVAAAEGAILVTTRNHKRSGFATEIAGTLRNPALEFDYRLSGAQLGATADICIDAGMVLPLTLNIEASGYRLDGSDSIDNQTFLGGFGITGIGGTPGVYVNSPTDLLNASFDTERTGSIFSLGLDLPLRMDVHDGSGGSGMGGRGSVGVTSIFFGLRGGSLDQSETTTFHADTPAFGASSDWRGRYDTTFDGSYTGAYAGLGYARTFLGVGNRATTFSLSGQVGYDAYDFDVTEKVRGQGLGGALNYANSQNHRFSDTVLSASLRASIDVRLRNFSYGGFLEISSGATPEINRFLPDSTPAGAKDPKYSLDASPSATLGIYGTYRF